ncbi:MAG TPA: nucleoside deaminase [bacterium]|nr:nucleoside deaminase [bacterium]
MDAVLTPQFLRTSGFAALLPDWIQRSVEYAALQHYDTDNERLMFAIELSRLNIQNDTGGPFGAAVFHRETGKLLGIGVNRVIAAGDPTAHAEVLALRLASRIASNYSLREAGTNAGLYASAEPCGMCATAALWAGVSAIIYGASTADVEAIGFDEGLKPKDWEKGLLRRGVTVQGGLFKDEAAAVLKDYKARGGAIYNG